MEDRWRLGDWAESVMVVPAPLPAVKDVRGGMELPHRTQLMPSAAQVVSMQTWVRRSVASAPHGPCRFCDRLIKSRIE